MTTVHQIRKLVTSSANDRLKVIYRQLRACVALGNTTVATAKAIELTKRIFQGTSHRIKRPARVFVPSSALAAPPVVHAVAPDAVLPEPQERL